MEEKIEIIRRYSPPDLEGIKQLVMNIEEDDDALLAASSLKLLELDAPDVLSYVAEDCGLIVGFNVGFILSSGCLIPEGMYVDPEYRRRGIAKMLSEALENGSRCNVSIAYYKKDLEGYYARLGYTSGDVIVGIKEIGGK